MSATKKLSLFLLMAAMCGAQAEELRDPTSWPAGVQAPSASSPASAAEPDTASPRIQQIVVIDGRAYIVSGGRRYGVGAQFGDAKIMRIEEQGVWLRNAAGTRRESLYPGIEKRLPTAAEAHKKTTRGGVSASAQENP